DLPILTIPADGAEPSDSVSHGVTEIALDRDEAVSRVMLNGVTVIEGDISACLWRASTDNDGGQNDAAPQSMPGKSAAWAVWGLDAVALQDQTVAVHHLANSVLLSRSRLLSGLNGQSASHRTIWALTDSGVDISEEITIPEAWNDLPRVGIRFNVPKQFSELEWLGLGPDESYPDRYRAQTFGRWSSSVSEQYHPYVRPQEYGAHEQTRSFRLTDGSGLGFEVVLPRPMSFTARPHHDVDLGPATTIAELQEGETTEVHIDAAVRGVGTGACGPDVLDQYIDGPGTYRFDWSLRPISG
ncbi:MAG: beta-galactosidase small subunit, partial [Pseudomonadota bacterium]